jgi:hypothetical protein
VTFNSDRYGYSVSHPPGWHVREAKRDLAPTELPHPGSPAVDWFGENEDPNGFGAPGPQFEISTHPVPQGTSLEAFAAATVKLESREAGCEEPDSREDIELDGAPATLLAYTCHADASVLWVVSVHDGQGYYLIWLNDPGDEESDRIRFDEVLDSFAFAA